MKNNDQLKRKQFIRKISDLRKMFPEHAVELDRCIYDVLKKNPCCNNLNCSCQMTFEQFHQTTNKVYKKSFN
jgi:hypothetical protein